MSTSSSTTLSCCDSSSACALSNQEAAGSVENTFAGFFSHLFDTSSYPARWNCGEWTSIEGWLHIGSDILIFLAYLAIPISLLYCLWKRNDVPFNRILILFSAFILSCGTGHLLEAVIFYWPIYRVAGLLKLTTAIVSVATAIVLMRLLPRILDLPSLANRNDLLERAAKSKSEFLANMSHEIRTPMTAILGYASILAEAENDTKKSISKEDRLNAVQTIQKSGQHLLTIINDVLDMSKIEANRIEISKSNVAVDPLLQEIVDLMKPQAESKGIELRLSYANQVPSTIVTDPGRLRQILINLIGNAIKFTELGSVTLNLSNSASEAGAQLNSLCFSVTDTGIGIANDQLETLRKFEAFTQADGSTSRTYGGTGLGLRISNSLANLLGGKIEIASVQGVGSTFRLNLLVEGLIQEETVDHKKSTKAWNKNASLGCDSVEDDSAKDEPLPLADKKILLVEDGHDNQRLITFFLNRAGAEVILRENGRAGVDQALLKKNQGEEFDLILMDMQMPLLDGYDATRELRGVGYDGKIIALTAHAMAEDSNRCLAAGCDAYLSKPIDRLKLVEKCQKAINSHASSNASSNS